MYPCDSGDPGITVHGEVHQLCVHLSYRAWLTVQTHQSLTAVRLGWGLSFEVSLGQHALIFFTC